MIWLHNLDVGLFRFINETLNNPIFDKLMPAASGKGTLFYFFIIIALIALLIGWKGGKRGRICLLMLALIVGPGDSYICNPIKKLTDRPRPFRELADVHRLVGAGKSSGMPSSHTANWFAATMIFYIYYRRRSLWFVLPPALVVSFSRIYVGVHYPSDVLAGAILGAGYAAAGVWTLDALWKWAGRKWLPNWWKRLPSLMIPDLKINDPQAAQQNS